MTFTFYNNSKLTDGDAFVAVGNLLKLKGDSLREKKRRSSYACLHLGLDIVVEYRYLDATVIVTDSKKKKAKGQV